MWLNKNGKINWISNINQSTYQKYKGADLSYRPYFTIPKQTHMVYYSSLIESNDKVPRLYLSYPVINTTSTKNKQFVDKEGTFNNMQSMLEKLITGLSNAINQQQTITLATNQFNSGLFKIGGT